MIEFFSDTKIFPYPEYRIKETYTLSYTTVVSCLTVCNLKMAGNLYRPEYFGFELVSRLHLGYTICRAVLYYIKLDD